MGIVQKIQESTAMENLSQFLLRRLALFPPASPSKLLHTRQGPIQAVLHLFYVQGKPIPATGFQTVEFGSFLVFTGTHSLFYSTEVELLATSNCFQI